MSFIIAQTSFFSVVATVFNWSYLPSSEITLANFPSLKSLTSARDKTARKIYAQDGVYNNNDNDNNNNNNNNNKDV